MSEYKKRKNPFNNNTTNEIETTDADKHLFLDVFNVCKSLKKDTTITKEKVIDDIVAGEEIENFIQDFENSSSMLNKTKLQNIAKLTNSFKNIETVENKIKASKTRLIKMIAAAMWETGISKTNFNKDKFLTWLKNEQEKKHNKTINKTNKDIIMKS